MSVLFAADDRSRIREVEQTQGNLRVANAQIEARLGAIESTVSEIKSDVSEIRKTQMEIHRATTGATSRRLPKWAWAALVALGTGCGAGAASVATGGHAASGAAGISPGH